MMRPQLLGEAGVADIFVSYTSNDRDWAFWIGQELEKLGHKPRIHDWEISGGGNIVAWMVERHHKADRVLGVISNEYLTKAYSLWERQAAEWAAASDRPDFFLPVFIESCDVPTLLAPRKRCDLYGVTEEEARARLKLFVKPAGKPSGAFRFPGGTKPANEPPKAVAAFPGAKLALSNVPITVPRHFLGREDVLADIKIALAKDQGRVAITALHGLRGVGKTTLAAAYADRHRADYRATWWIRAQTESTMRADLVALGVRLGWVAADEKEEPALTAVRERLRDEGENILLIFDNASSADEIKPYLPVSGAAQILVTSNAPNWGSVAAPMQIRVWLKETGAEFFLSRVTGRNSEREAAEKLSVALGGLPLAHEQAAAFCERLGISFFNYLERFEATPATLLDAAKDAPIEYHDRITVAKTFTLAIDEAANVHLGAKLLIAHAAFLAPEPIPLFLFAEARDKFEEPLASALLGNGLDEAIAALRAFALIDRESIADERDQSIMTECIRLHRLVRQVAQLRQDEKRRQLNIYSVMKGLAHVYPDDVWNDPATWPRARRLDALVLAMLDEADILPSAERLASNLSFRLARYKHRSLAAYTQARALYERALTIEEKTPGALNSSATTIRSYLASLLIEQNNYAAARPILESILTLREKSLGPDHVDLGESLNDLAIVVEKSGDLAAARTLYERALTIYESSLGSAHHWTATILVNLADLVLNQGDVESAKPLMERALRAQAANPGSVNPNLSRVRSNLAQLLLAGSGDASEALTLSEVALQEHEKMLGHLHPWTRAAARVNSNVLDALGRAAEAKALRERYGIGADDALRPS